jgi:hypothetical protein
MQCPDAAVLIFFRVMPTNGVPPSTLTSDDRLVLIRVKIERAKTHLMSLETLLRKFRHESLNVVGTKDNRETGQSTRFHIDLPILPFDAIAAAGDTVHNLRSSLDHLACQLVIVGSGKEPTRRVEFPIAKDSETYESEKAKKVEGMADLAIKQIDGLKPYKGGNNALWRIHELDNIDKHRSLFTVSHDYLLVAGWMPVNTYLYWLKTDEPHFTGVFDSEVENDLQRELDKVTSEGKVAESDALLPSLRQLVESVEDLVFSFRPLLE